MPGSTTPDNIVYPVTGDKMSPLNGWFSQLAGSVQTALTGIRTELTQAPLPAPVSVTGADMQSITATTWTDLPNMQTITLNLPQACWVTITMGGWIFATAGDVRFSSRVTGATSLAENQLDVGGPNNAWGQVMYADASTLTRQSSTMRTVRLNAGSNVIAARAYRNASSGTQNVNYSTMQVAPLRWA